MVRAERVDDLPLNELDASRDYASEVLYPDRSIDDDALSADRGERKRRRRPPSRLAAQRRRVATAVAFSLFLVLDGAALGYFVAERQPDR